MKKFNSFLLLLFVSVGILTANDLKQQITPADLGYASPARIIYFEQIDENNIGLIVEDNQAFKDSWIYNLNTGTGINISYQDSLYGRFENVWDYYPDHSFYDFGRYLHDGDLVYSIVSYFGEGNIEQGVYVLETNLATMQQKVQYLHPYCNARFGFLRSDDKNFIVESNCETPFSLFALDDSTWSQVWSVEDFGWPDISNFDSKIPFYHQGKIYLSAQNKLYTFNTSDYTIDTIINDTRDTEGVTDACISMATQYFVHGDDVYIVYRDVWVYDLGFYYVAMNGDGYTRIWKTDGTKAGTELLNRIPKTDEMTGSLQNSKLFELDNRLLWLGDIDMLWNFQIYEVNEGAFESLGGLTCVEDVALINYNSLYGFNNLSFYLYNDIVPVSFQDRDLLAYVQMTTVESEGMKYYLSLIGLDGNSLEILQENHQVYSEIEDGNEYSTLITGIRAWNVGEKLAVSRFGEISTDSTNVSILDFLVSDDYRVIEFDTVNPPGLVSPSFGLYSFKIGEELFFNYGDDEDGNLIVWSLNGREVTALKNNISGNQPKLSVYPNPASQSIIIQSGEHLDGQMMIVGIDGKIHQTFRANGLQQQIDVSKLPNGMYVAVYNGGSNTGTQSFIIQR